MFCFFCYTLCSPPRMLFQILTIEQSIRHRHGAAAVTWRRLCPCCRRLTSKQHPFTLSPQVVDLVIIRHSEITFVIADETIAYGSRSFNTRRVCALLGRWRCNFHTAAATSGQGRQRTAALRRCGAAPQRLRCAIGRLAAVLISSAAAVPAMLVVVTVMCAIPITLARLHHAGRCKGDQAQQYG